MTTSRAIYIVLKLHQQVETISLYLEKAARTQQACLEVQKQNLRQSFAIRDAVLTGRFFPYLVIF